MSALIPFYSYDGAYLDHITVKRATRLENSGVAKVVRHKKGHINRVILLRGKDDPRPTTLHDYRGKRYSFQQLLKDGQVHGSFVRCRAAGARLTLRRRS